jgi:glutamate dehydrogenase/leucine dehydrogenase
MTGLLAMADELGPAKVIQLHQPAAGLSAVLAVDNVACGPAIGGIRMAPDVTAAEAIRLARAMTLKNAAAGLAHGGGKAVIVGDPRMPAERKERIIRAFARAIEGERDYIPGPDMGTDERCMGWIHDEIGRAAGLPRAIGGIPLDEIGATGLGLAAAIEVACGFAGIPLRGARFAVQGFGAVGQHAARHLVRAGAVLVAAADSGATVAAPEGLDLAALLALKQGGGRLADHGAGRTLPRDAIVAADCDIWIPAARPDVIHAGNQATLKAKLVACGANIPCTPEAEAALHARGVLVLPDYIANAGGVICAAVEYHGGSEEQAVATIGDRLRANMRAVLEEARRTGEAPRAAADALALARVRTAAGLRRFGPR